MYAVALNKQIDANKIILEIEKLIKKYHSENNGLDDAVLVISLNKIIQEVAG